VNWCRSSARRLAISDAVMALAAVFMAVVSAQGQSQPAVPPPGCASNFGSETVQQDAVIGLADAAIGQARHISFSELAQVDLGVRTFHSQSDYFRTRFSTARFLLLMRMRYFIEVNPAVAEQQARLDGVCAILAHELVHVVSMSRGNRIRRLGLVRLLSKRYTAKFERGADLEAIHRGYGDGLKHYRSWVYTHIPPSKLPEKLRNYFSPEEIAAIEARLQQQPDLFRYWKKHVPRSLQEIQNLP
jgi:hypothetical protein